MHVVLLNETRGQVGAATAVPMARYKSTGSGVVKAS